MRAAWQLAIKSLAGRRGRSLLLLGAVAAATVLMVGVAASLGTLGRSVEHAMGRFGGLVDLRLSHRFAGQLDAGLLSQVRSWPEVRTATGRLEVLVTLQAPRTGESLSVLTIGADPEADAQLHPMKLRAGRRQEGPGEVVVGDRTRAALGAELGDTLVAQTLGTRVELKLVGVYEQPNLGSLQRGRAVVDLATAEKLSGMPGKLARIEVRLHPDQDVAAVQARRQAELPEAVELAAAAASRVRLREALGVASLLLTGLTLLTTLAAAFLILSSLTTAVTEQLHELAILRCVGASRGQIAAAQLLSGAILGGGGALAGVPIGLALAFGLYRHYREWLAGGFDANLPRVALVVLCALLAGVLGAAYPAVLAARVSPLSALTRRARPPRRWGVIACLVAGLGAISVMPALVFSGLDAQHLAWFYLYAGMPLLLIGYLLLSVPALVLATPVAAPVLARVAAVPATLLRQTVLSSPYRNAFTAATLMLGLALLVAVWTNGRNVVGGWLGRLVMPDAFAFSIWPMTPAQLEALRRVPVVEATSATAFFPVEPVGVQFGLRGLSPQHTLFVSFEPESFFVMARLDWVQGDPETATRRLRAGRAILVTREFHVARGLGVGDPVTLKTLQGPVAFTIAGVVGSPGLDVAVHFFGLERAYGQSTINSIFGTREDAIRYFDHPEVRLVLLKLRPEVSDEAALAEIRGQIPGLATGSARELREHVTSLATKLMAAASAVALGALGLACVGVSNLLIAEVIGRRYEYGVLRAVGAGRGLLGRLVAAQTLLLALVGCVLGTALGLQGAWVGQVFHQRLGGLTYPGQTPWDMIALGAAIVAAAALLAAGPAIWRVVRASPRALLAAR